MKRKMLLVLVIPVLYLMLQSCDDPKKAKKYDYETTVNQEGLNFIDNAMEGGRTEIRLSMIAQHNSSDPRVLNFAKMMVSDHIKAIEGLKKLQKSELVDAPDGITESQKKIVDNIAKLSGSQFDKAYMAQMVADHEDAVNLFKEGSENRLNAVQSYAQKTLPTIEMHLNSAREINAKLQ